MKVKRTVPVFTSEVTLTAEVACSGSRSDRICLFFVRGSGCEPLREVKAAATRHVRCNPGHVVRFTTIRSYGMSTDPVGPRGPAAEG